MKKLSKILCVLMVIVCLMTSLTSFASAKTFNSKTLLISTGTGYLKYNNTRMYNQTKNEVAVTKISKNKVVTIQPYISYATNKYSKLTKYVRYSVWIYDINTGKLLDQKECSEGKCITWKNKTGKKANISVQVYPYISQSAWKKYDTNFINGYIFSSNYKVKCKY